MADPGIGALRSRVSEGPTRDESPPAWGAVSFGPYLLRGGLWIQSVIGLLDVATQRLESSKEAAQSAIEQATSLLLQGQRRLHSRGRSRAPGGLLAWQVRKVQEFVDAHIADRILVSDLGAVVQLSEAHFSRLFTRAFGLTPHAFVLRRRLALAAQLMLESTESLTDIALCCGFTDQAHLCKHFRRSMGVTPAAWRRARLGGQRSWARTGTGAARGSD
jgi:AraC family transcriptional regulator